MLIKEGRQALFFLMSSQMMNSVGKHTYFGENQHVRRWVTNGELHIGSYCSIADNVTYFLGGNHHTEWVTTYPLSKIRNLPEGPYGPVDSTKGDIVIGNDVWIGSHATIMSGVRVGDGAVIGAHSLVTKDVPPYTIVGGNPAKILKTRFDASTVTRLQKASWWNLEDSQIVKLAPLLESPNIDLFLSTVESLNV